MVAKNLGLTSTEFDYYKNFLEKTTRFSSNQIWIFLSHLENRFKELKIYSIKDLETRHKQLDCISQSELLVEIAGRFHFSLLSTLLRIIREDDHQVVRVLKGHNERGVPIYEETMGKISE